MIVRFGYTKTMCGDYSPERRNYLSGDLIHTERSLKDERILTEAHEKLSIDELSKLFPPSADEVVAA